MASLQLAIQRARAVMRGFTPGQIAVVAFAVIGLVVAGLLFSRWSASPYTPLYSNLEASDAGAIAQQLDSMAVPYQLADGGSQILVPPDQVSATRLALSSQGLPADSRDGYALLDQQGITTSEFVQNVTYQRAMEGEIARTIEAIDGVEAASVHLGVPADSVFTQESEKASASVLVSLRPGATLDPGQVQAITSLVASSIPKLSASDVTVADSSGQLLTGAGGANSAQLSARLEAQLTLQAQSMLDTVLGTGNSQVRIHTDLDFDQRQTTVQSYSYPKNVPPLTSTTTNETYSGRGPGQSTVAGTTTLPVTPGTPGSTKYQKDSSTTANSVDSTVEERTANPGSIKRMTVALVVNSTVPGVNTVDLSNLVANAVGLDTTRGDTIQVTQMAFDQSIQAAAAQQLQAAQEAQGKEDLLTLARRIGVVLLVLAVLLLAWLSSRRQRRTVLGFEALDAGGMQPRAISSAAPAIAADLLETNILDARAAPSAKAIQIDQSHAAIASLVERQPDEAAQLLRGWIADRR